VKRTIVEFGISHLWNTFILWCRREAEAYWDRSYYYSRTFDRL